MGKPREGSAKPGGEPKGIQKVVSKIQRALGQGKATGKELREIEGFMAKRMRKLLEVTSKGLDSIPFPRSKNDKERVALLKSDLRTLLSHVRGLGGRGYSVLSSREDYVDPRGMKVILDSDDRIFAIFYSLNQIMERVGSRGRWTKLDEKDFENEVRELEWALKERKALAARV